VEPSPAELMLQQVGPDFLDDAGLRGALTDPDDDTDVPAPDPAALRADRAVLALRTADEAWIYPSWQVVDSRVLPGLPAVLDAMAAHPAWSVAVWLTTATDELDGATPVAHLATDPDRVVEVARAVATRWA